MLIARWLRNCLVRSFTYGQSASPRVGLRTGLFGPSTPVFEVRSAATNLKNRSSLDQKSLMLACGLTYQTVSDAFKLGLVSPPASFPKKNMIGYAILPFV